MKISTGRKISPVKTVVYGPEGIGKSTFASQFPNPVFIDTEGSTKHMANVSRFDDINEWQDIMDAVLYTTANVSKYQTLVIDTADWAEMMCIRRVCKNNHVNGIEDIGYGKGYVYVQEEFKKLLDALDNAVSMGLNVIITAHAKMRKFEQPDEMGAYDRWEMKLTKQVAPMLKEWADMVLFANYKTTVITDDKTKSKKAQGGTKRVMYTTHHACWDAKNRFDLEDCIPFEFAQIKDVISLKASALGPISSPEPKEEPIETEQPEEISFAYHSLKQLMEKAHITDEEVQCACSTKGLQKPDAKVQDYSDEFIEKMLIAKFDGFAKYINKEIKGIPFIKHYEEAKK